MEDYVAGDRERMLGVGHGEPLEDAVGWAESRIEPAGVRKQEWNSWRKT
jgi:hypothetical protein